MIGTNFVYLRQTVYVIFFSDNPFTVIINCGHSNLLNKFTIVSSYLHAVLTNKISCVKNTNDVPQAWVWTAKIYETREDSRLLFLFFLGLSIFFKWWLFSHMGVFLFLKKIFLLMIITVLSFMACYWYMSICIGLSPSARILADLQELQFLQNNCSTLTLWVSTFLFTILFCYWCFCCNFQLGTFNVLLFFVCFCFQRLRIKNRELKVSILKYLYLIQEKKNDSCQCAFHCTNLFK